jgi:hypothetical protein
VLDNSAIAGRSTPDASGQHGGIRAWTLQAVAWLVPAENPGGVVYGVIAIGALLAAESGQHDSYPDTVASAMIGMGLYWLAHAYASLLGRRLSARERLTGKGLSRALVHDWAVVRGGAIPLLALLVAWSVGVARETAVTAALWCAVASVIAFELAAGIRSGGTRSELTLELSVGVAIGVAIIALKVLLHR